MRLDVENTDTSDALKATTGTICRLFADAFEVDHCDPADDFFELGGDSLIGEALVLELERQYKVGLSISVLMEATTPSELAKLILANKATDARSAMTSVQESGDPPTFLCLHGTDGESHFPKQLATTIGERRPIYAFRGIGLEAGETPSRTVEEMAGAYLAALSEAHTQAPYLIVAHCAGCTLAMEMALQFEAAGIGLSGLVLIDPEDYEELAPFLYKSGLELMLFRQAWTRRVTVLEEAMASNPNPTVEQRKDLVAHWIKYAVGIYDPKPYAGPTLMCLTDERVRVLDPEKGYPSLLSDLTVVRLPGISHEQLFDEGLERVVGAIDDFLAM